MINVNSYVAITNNEVDLHKLDDEWVVVDKNQEKIAVMNESAFFVWEYIRKKGKIKIQELFCGMSNQYSDIDKAQIEYDIVEIVDLMIREQLLYEL